MVLGTVQLGLNYGINNRTGKPSKQQAFEILDFAYNNNVDILDTASGYGDSERIIGSYIESTGNTFRICTKLPVDINCSSIKAAYEESISLLKIQSIYVYYLHRFEQCKDSEILREMILLKNEKKIEKIGVSIYEPEELEYIIDNISDIIDVVQIPFSIIDNYRWLNNGLLARAKKLDIDLYVRSVYLQGLILVSPDSEVALSRGANEVLSEIGTFANKHHVGVDLLAVSYVNAIPYITNYLLGVETPKQLERNIKVEKECITFDDDMIEEIMSISKKCSRSIIDPRVWER